MSESKAVSFRFGLLGLFSKNDPELLSDGQYRSLLNLDALQEGLLYSRTGRRKIGYLIQTSPTTYTCTMIRKLVVSPGIESQGTPSTNLRYLGIATAGVGLGHDDLYRTTDYTDPSIVGSRTVKVAKNINLASVGPSSRFSLAPYSPGEVGSPWAYIASSKAMLKDRGQTPYTTPLAASRSFPAGGNLLPLWGILPAFGVAYCDYLASGGSIASATNANPVQFTTSAALPADLKTGMTIGIHGGLSNSTSNWAPLNGAWTVTVTGTHTFTVAYDTTSSGAVLGSLTYTIGNLSSASFNGVATGATPYDWRYTYVGTDTNNEGNPSQVMTTNGFSSTGFQRTYDNLNYYVVINPVGQSVTIKCWGTDDPQCPTGTGLINIYRRGGILYDTWRFVGSVVNPGLGVLSAAFTDNTADADLVYAKAKVLEVDNDPPVPSRVATPIIATLSVDEGRQTITNPLVAGIGFTPSGIFVQVLPGSLMHITDEGTYGGVSFSEDVIIESVGNIGNQITAFFQSPHRSIQAEVDAICGMPVPLAISFQQFLVLAGDPNNPHYLYRSKGDQPESFPVTPADGSVAVISCGTPSNPIQNLCNFRGNILTLNLNSLFETTIINGSLQQPWEAANRGTVSRFAWCKTDTEVWFVSTDGVWSWDGGSLRKRSEAIDPLFHGQMYNRIQPVDMSATGISAALPNGAPGGLSLIQMEYYRGEIYLLFQDILGEVRVLKCNPNYNDRWSPHYLNMEVGAADQPTTFLYNESDIGNLIHTRVDPNGVIFSVMDVVKVDQPTYLNLTNDEYASGPPSYLPPSDSNGGGIFFAVTSPWFDMGSAAIRKVFEEVWLEIFNSTSNLTVSIFTDYNDAVVVDTILVPPQADQWSVVPLLPGVTGSPSESYGREARAICFSISGQTTYKQVAFRTLSFRYQETGLLTAGGSQDWTDLGWKFDKKLYQITVEFDTGHVGQTLLLDMMTGPSGSNYVPADTSNLKFVLDNPLITGSGRAKQSFPLPDGTIAKLIRIRFVQGTIPFRILDVQFKKEDFPEDVVIFTPWESCGSELNKYLNQVDLEVNTNGVPVSVQIKADGSNVGPAFTVTATESDRRRNITMPPNIQGKNFQIFVNPNQAAILTGGGMFQLFSHRLVAYPADPGDVGHTEDFKDGGWPWDKRLQTMTIQWDSSGQAVPVDVVFVMDIISGIDGGTLQPAVATFNLGVGTGRSQKVFPLQDGIICKKVRVYPQTSPLPLNFRSWSYSFEPFEKFPPDRVYFSEPQVFDWDLDKEGRLITVKIDTGGVDCQIQAEVDSVLLGPVFTVNTTLDDWKRELPLPPGVIGRLWKLKLTPGVGGKSQLFSFLLEFDKCPPHRISFTPPENGGHEYDKYFNQIDLEVNTGGYAVVFNVQADGNTVATFTVTSTYNDRRRNFTAPPNLKGKNWRLYIDLTQPAIVSGGWFQLWNHRFVFQDADMKDVLTVGDWDSLGHLWDKQLRSVTIDWDCNVDGILETPVTVQMDTINGISGQDLNVNVAQFVLANGRSKKEFPLPPDLVAKMIRLYPIAAPNVLFKKWRYNFDKVDDPADIVEWTVWSDCGWIYEKLMRNLIIEVDTGGVPAEVQIQSDGRLMQTLTINTTYTTRRQVIALDFNLLGLLWRLVITPGVGGKFKLWQHSFDYIKEPGYVTQWSSYQQAFRLSNWKVLKEYFLEYISPFPLNITFESETGSISFQFPAHASRSSERYLFPTVWSGGLNKSREVSLIITSSDRFKIYLDGSSVLFYAIGSDRHQAYIDFKMSEFEQIPIGQV